MLLKSFPYFMADLLARRNPDHKLSAGHLLLCEKLQRVADGEIDKLMCFCPSSWGKTTILSHGFAAWMMMRRPKVRLIGASHNGEFAENKVSRPVQDVIREYSSLLGVGFKGENAKEWSLENGATYRAAGVTAGIMGERMDGGIIDDPFASVADAKSAIIRDRVYDWFRGTWTSRFEIGVPTWQVLMHQRLHGDDLAARLMAEEGDKWEILHLPARFEGLDWRGELISKDELGRTQIGQSIWPEVWTDDALNQRESDVGPYAWASMFQQRPMPVGGTIFLPANLKIIEGEASLSKAKRIVMACDYGAAKTKGDYTAICLMQENSGHGWTIRDITRSQGGPDAMEATIVDAAAKYAEKLGGRTAFKIWLPQDAGAAGAYLAGALVKALAGYDVEIVRESGSKEIRATPFASQVNAGNVWLLEGAWNKAFKDELECFPGGKHDDMVDAASTAFAHLIPEPVLVSPPRWGFNRMRAR